MEQPKAPSSPKQAKANPPLRRGQTRNRILKDIFKSFAAYFRPAPANGAAGSSGTATPISSIATPISSSAYTSEGTADS